MSNNVVTLGVIADTHIPDRIKRLDSRILPLFRAAGVSAILHAGDVSAPHVLVELEKVAPVYAVRGNRDWVLLPDLPSHRELEFAGVQIALTHGHGRWWNYLVERPYFLFYGFRLERIQPRLQASFPDARVIVFGHSHQPLNSWVGNQLLFNPGSPHFPQLSSIPATVGLLHIKPGGVVEGELIDLDDRLPAGY